MTAYCEHYGTMGCNKGCECAACVIARLNKKVDELENQLHRLRAVGPGVMVTPSCNHDEFQELINKMTKSIHSLCNKNTDLRQKYREILADLQRCIDSAKLKL